MFRAAILLPQATSGFRLDHNQAILLSSAVECPFEELSMVAGLLVLSWQKRPRAQ
jgi:hypothetical protein